MLKTSFFAFTAALAVMTSAASAAPIVTASLGGAATGTILDNLDTLTPGSAGGVTSTGISVSFAGSGQAVVGASSGQYAAPFLSGGNGAGFGNPNGNQIDGADASVYLTAGGDSSSYAKLSFTSALHDIGLLWGSIDSDNTLELFNGSTLVGTITGTEAAAAAALLPNGNQGAMGTAYVNIYSSDVFDNVVALSTSPAFEFDNISYSSATSSVPEPLTLSLFGAGLAGAAAMRRRKTVNKA